MSDLVLLVFNHPHLILDLLAHLLDLLPCLIQIPLHLLNLYALLLLEFVQLLTLLALVYQKFPRLRDFVNGKIFFDILAYLQVMKFLKKLLVHLLLLVGLVLELLILHLEVQGQLLVLLQLSRIVLNYLLKLVVLLVLQLLDDLLSLVVDRPELLRVALLLLLELVSQLLQLLRGFLLLLR